MPAHQGFHSANADAGKASAPIPLPYGRATYAEPPPLPDRLRRMSLIWLVISIILLPVSGQTALLGFAAMMGAGGGWVMLGALALCALTVLSLLISIVAGIISWVTTRRSAHWVLYEVVFLAGVIWVIIAIVFRW